MLAPYMRHGIEPLVWWLIGSFFRRIISPPAEAYTVGVSCPPQPLKQTLPSSQSRERSAFGPPSPGSSQDRRSASPSSGCAGRPATGSRRPAKSRRCLPEISMINSGLSRRDCVRAAGFIGRLVNEGAGQQGRALGFGPACQNFGGVQGFSGQIVPRAGVGQPEAVAFAKGDGGGQQPRPSNACSGVSGS